MPKYYLFVIKFCHSLSHYATPAVSVLHLSTDPGDGNEDNRPSLDHRPALSLPSLSSLFGRREGGGGGGGGGAKQFQFQTQRSVSSGSASGSHTYGRAAGRGGKGEKLSSVPFCPPPSSSSSSSSLFSAADKGSIVDQISALL
jgi:hypothetical protein